MEKLVNTIQELNKASCFDYIQTIVSIISVIVSGIALIFAIRVPKKIAKEQNRIALLDKRTQIYLDFVDLFSSQISWPLALPNACGANIKRVNIWDREIKNKFAVAEFLFSSDLQKNLVRLKELYIKIKCYDGYIDEGLECIHNEEDKQILLKLFSEEGLGMIDESELKELKRLTEEYEFVHQEPKDEYGLEMEYISMNLFLLSEEQKKFAKEAKELQDIVLEKMREELRLLNEL